MTVFLLSRVGYRHLQGGSTLPFGMRLQQYALPSGDPCGRTVAFPSHAVEVHASLQQ